ncbi:hypothetical protein FGRMN_2777 [Fusarium graminum]|nr:hypothetical protein FGRMN_2777 [Fusarium graminum]
MSGIEVVGLITATITIVETISKIYNGLKDAEGLPKAFQEVSGGLPLVQTVLEAIEEQIRPDDNSTAIQAMVEVVTRCKIRTEDLERIFKAVMSSEGMSRFERYRKVVRQLGKEKKVEILAKQLLEDLQEAIEELSQVGPSLPNEDGINLTQSGSGDNIAGNKIIIRSLYLSEMEDRVNYVDNKTEGTWKPGSGKSTLLRFALDRETLTPKSKDAAVLLSLFFHERGIELQRTLTGFFRSLLYQLLEQAPDAPNDMVTTFQRRCEDRGVIITKLIVKRARGVFLWARLILNKVQPLLQEGLSVAKIEAEIDRMPEDPTDFYGQIIKATRYRFATRDLMESVCFSLRALTTDELRWTLAVDPHRRPVVSLDQCSRSADFISFDDAEMRIKSLGCGLTEIIEHWKSRIVQFIHPSVKGFLLQGGLSILDHSTRKTPNLVAVAAHCRLSLICVCYLQVILTFHPEALDERNKSKFPLLHYAVTSWAVHAELGQTQDTFTRDLLSLIGRSSKRFIKSWIMLYQRIDPQSRDCPSTGSTLLHVVSRYGLTKLLSRLLSITNKASINARDQDRQTPLLLAARYGHTAAVKLLLHAGNVDIMARDKLGRTLLCRAAQEGHLEVAELLSRQEQALVNAGDNYNWTPLSLATDSGHAGVTKLLLDTNGINVYARDVVQGQTPLQEQLGMDMPKL